MAKKKTSFTISQDAIDMLLLLCEKHVRSQGSMIEVLIREAAAKEGITPPKPKKG